MRGEGGEGGGGRGEGETEFVERLLRMLLGWLTQLEATGSRSLGKALMSLYSLILAYTQT